MQGVRDRKECKNESKTRHTESNRRMRRWLGSRWLRPTLFSSFPPVSEPRKLPCYHASSFRVIPTPPVASVPPSLPPSLCLNVNISTPAGCLLRGRELFTASFSVPNKNILRTWPAPGSTAGNGDNEFGMRKRGCSLLTNVRDKSRDMQIFQNKASDARLRGEQNCKSLHPWSYEETSCSTICPSFH